MNRVYFLFLFCFLGALACRHKKAGEKDGDSLAPIEAQGQKDSVAGVYLRDSAGNGNSAALGTGAHALGSDVPDTSILALKSFTKVSFEDVLSQVWKMDDADQPHWNQLFWDSGTNTRKFPEIALFRDLAVTENARCGIQMGRWHLNKNTRELVLRFANGLSKTYIIRNITVKQMELVWKRGANDEADIILKAGAMAHKRPREDPFYPSNNQWRIKPRVTETHEQIRLRVKGFVHFFAQFYWDSYRRQEMDISYSGLPCCFEWYDGGIGMQSRSDLDKRWMDCFYSDDEAFKGYDMLADILQRHELKWPEHPSSWVQQTAQVLDQMEEKL
jgi:hypothetical protein